MRTMRVPTPDVAAVPCNGAEKPNVDSLAIWNCAEGESLMKNEFELRRTG